MAEQLVDRPLRSVFVGNIPYEVTEEKLKEIFSEVGPVVSMKLVYDRETGKPKGYGFCEYKDVETAMSAMRNLNGSEINGRILRVDNAGAERHRMTEVSNQNAGHNGPRHHDNHEHHAFLPREPEGPPLPEKVPEVISKAVASLPPDQMFEIMKQMKFCIQNNPNEARTMLLQNPQLAYALLQAQVVMKIIDPQTALSMLHKDNTIPVGTLLPEGQIGSMMMGPPGGFGPPPPPTENPWIAAGAVPGGAPVMPLNPPGPFGPGPVQNQMGAQNQNQNQGGDMDFRQMDPRLRNQPGGPPQDLDLRDPRAGPGQDRFSIDPRQRDRDLRDRDRDLRDRDMRTNDRDLRDRDLRDRDIRDPRIQTGPPQGNMPSDPRARRDREQREPPISQQPASTSASRAAAALPAGMGGLGPGATDTEKAALIMQVLQLSDEQIAMLPPEQRQSILVLKEQIAKSTSQNR